MEDTIGFLSRIIKYNLPIPTRERQGEYVLFDHEACMFLQLVLSYIEDENLLKRITFFIAFQEAKLTERRELYMREWMKLRLVT